MRANNGQFLSGHSGNPSGRPKDKHQVAELARIYSAEAIETLVDLMRNAKEDRVRGTAAQALLDSGWGKPKVEVATKVSNDSEVFIDALQEIARHVKERQS